MLDLVVLAASLVLAASPPDDVPTPITVEVGAGAHERRGTLVSFPLPERFRAVRSFTVVSADNGVPVPGQVDGAAEPSVLWNLGPPLAADAKRQFELVPATLGPIAGESGPVKFRKDGDLLIARLGRQPVLSYHVGVAEPPAGLDPVYRRSGFIHPLTTRSGRVVTEGFPPGHAHQHGVFMAWVNTTFDGRKVDFWNQLDRTGRVGHDPDAGDPATRTGPVLGAFLDRLRHDALNTSGGPTTVLEETWDVRLYDIPGLVVLDFESRQRCVADKPLTINKYHYGGFGFRGNGQWLDPEAKGEQPPAPARSGRSEFTTSEGKHRADGNHTRPRWADLSGEVDGQMAGVTILDHPGNFRFPQPVRIHPNMPYFCFAPMVLDEFQIKPGETYVSRYRLIAHDGPPDPDLIERLWADYAEPPTVRVVEP